MLHHNHSKTMGKLPVVYYRGKPHVQGTVTLFPGPENVILAPGVQSLSGIVICNRIDCPGDSVPLVGMMLLPGKRFVVAVQRRFNVCEVLVSVARQIKLLPLDWQPWLPIRIVGVTESVGRVLITIVTATVWPGTVVPASLSDTVM